MSNPYVEVLLATYNGERFIREQLESLISQDYDNFRILVRDDGSTDSTIDIVRQFYHLHPGLIHIIEDEESTGSAKENFSKILDFSTARYIMFCDQDDIWMPHKISTMVRAILSEEIRFGDATPILVHSDLCLIDEIGRCISESFWKYQRISVDYSKSLNALLTQNIVTGCATIINRPLLQLSNGIPKNAVMHDWWLALLAISSGKIISLDECLTKYRQHGANVVGANEYRLPPLHIIYEKIIDRENIRKNLISAARQAECLTLILENKRQIRVCQSFASLPYQNLVARRVNIIVNRFWKMGLYRNFSWFIRV